MQKHLILIIYLFISMQFSSTILAQQKMQYEQVKNDPLKARIYTLENGLKVFLTVNKDEPRIQTIIGVRVGSKDDPAETTGLAHYFEHMMFKGTPNFGTTDWEKEKEILAEIEALFEQYRKETDSEIRKKLYTEIDALSFEASKLAIPNEYDKLMNAIGSNGTNAATGNDYTYYLENIPSNQIENWAKIQTDRFTYPVLRLFHTELETVYEEKNMSLTNDGRRMNEAMLAALFPNHPYGLQTTLGHPEHLKNPSMTEINNFFKKYYVSNNMAVAMSGDFDPDEAIAVIAKHLGKLKPGNAPIFKGQKLPALNEPKEVELVGLEAESVRLAYRFGGNGTDEALKANLISMILSNGKAGLIDLNLNQKQKTLSTNAYTWTLNDHSVLMLSGRNKAGQTLEEVKNLLLAEIELLKKGQFDDGLVEAAINNLKLREIQRYENNRNRAMTMLSSYLNRQEWSDIVNYKEKLGAISKKEIVDFANKYLKDNYVVIYKKQGKPEGIPIVDKPAITPIFINRDAQSDFFKSVTNAKTNKLSPDFVDYKKELTFLKNKSGLQIIYKQNEENTLFDLVYYFPFGSNEDKSINLAAEYLTFLGTSKLTPEQINQEFYKLACSFRVSASSDQTYIMLSGLSENQEKAVQLLENLLADAQPNEKALDNLVQDILKSRSDAKTNQRANFRALVDYATYGEQSPTTNIVSENELQALKPAHLITVIKKMSSYPHDILYYGPTDAEKITDLINKFHETPKEFLPIPEKVKFEVAETTQNRVLFAHYDGPQSNVQTVSKSKKYDEAILPDVSLFNAYFGGGMNAIVFQEMREKRGLAYSAAARYVVPNSPDENFRTISYIVTQNDKVIDALHAFNELFDEMPVSENAFNLAKESMMTDLISNRTTKMSVIWSYLNAKKMGRDYVFDQVMYEKIPTMTLEDVKKFNEKNIKNQFKTYVILGNENVLDLETIEKQFGPLERIAPETYFGY
uniref:M16 family metallopeptidase n=1 Tax=Flavobacterium sp. TaxID=239 RepID=UPI00404B448E